MLSTSGLEHYFNFRVLVSGYLPNIPWHLLIYFYSNHLKSGAGARVQFQYQDDNHHKFQQNTDY